MSEGAQVAFWSILGFTFGLLGLFSWWASRKPLRNLDEMREKGFHIYHTLEDGSESSHLHEMLPLMNIISWTGTIGFLLAAGAAIFTAAS